LGGGVARELISRGGIAVVFDVLPEEKGQEIVSAYSKDRAFYFKTDISDVDIVQANCAAALEKIPKGSLFGAVHCAAISRSRKWSAKMADSCKDFLEISKTNIYGTFVRLDPLNPSLSESEPVNLLTQSLRVRYYRSSTLAWQTPSTRSTRQTTTTLFLPGSLKSVA
jgi:NAD(P)-dependent dehydrogenase (short-subunit alcohol dehydrogenase family)